jgi:hypothetical protein
MIFEEWFQKEFLPQFAYSNDDPYKYESAARQAWEASQKNCVEECEIVVDNANDSAPYSMTALRARFFGMGAKVVLRDLKFRLRV